VYLWLDNRRNLQFVSPILHYSLTEVVCCVPTSRLRQFIKLHLLLPKTLQAVVYCVGDCAHHPARSIVIPQLAEHCIFFIIFFLFPILLIVRTCMIAQTVSNSIQHLFQRCFGLSGCRHRGFSRSDIFPLLRNRCLRILNSLSCNSRSLSLNNPQSISRSLHCSRCSFLICFPPKASFWLVSCVMLPMLGPLLPASLTCLHLLDDVDVCSALLICCICSLAVEKSSSSEH